MKTQLPYQTISSADNEVQEVLVKRDNLNDSSFKRIIREMGLKVTHQRMAILKALADGRAHVTAQEVFELVNQKHPEIGFATVYRFLRKMTEQNYVTEVRMGGLPARYELTPKRHHDHLTCTACGKIIEFENPQIESLQVKVAIENGFFLTGHVLELYGVCGDCQHGGDQGSGSSNTGTKATSGSGHSAH